MIPRECKRLAEVDFPIAVVSKHAAREKSIRHGHPLDAASVVGAAAAGVVPGDAAGATAARSVRSRIAPKNSRRRRGSFCGRCRAALGSTR